jgi:hypothetical protein
MKKYNNIYDIYPLTIICDRYCGAYSGGKYTAWNKEFYNIHEEVSADDNTCWSFWDECPYKVGIGNSVTDAVNDLIKKLN